MPILSAAAWFVLAILQVYRDRWHTWTETFFLFACFFAGLYAIGDWLFFGANSLESAQLAALISFTGLTLATNFFLLFTLVYVDRMRTWYWAFMIISFVMLIMIWIPNVTISRIVAPQGPGLYVPEFHPIPFGIYLVYTLTYGLAGVRNLYRLYSIVRESSKVVARRALGLMITFTFVLILGLATNGLLGIIGNTQVPPPFSTLLVLVAGVAYYTLYPAGRQRISEAIRLFQARRGYASWTDLLRDGEVDAVYVATPVYLHAEMAIAAAEAGKHVLCEKPMALDVQQCDRMMEAAERSRVKLGVAYYRRFYPILARVKELVAAGALGEVVAARADVFEPFDPGPDHPRQWLLEKSKAGGGPMFDFGCHRLEVLLHLLGPAIHVCSEVRTAALQREVEDTAVALLHFARGATAGPPHLA